MRNTYKDGLRQAAFIQLRVLFGKQLPARITSQLKWAGTAQLCRWLAKIPRSRTLIDIFEDSEVRNDYGFDPYDFSDLPDEDDVT